MSNQSHRRSGKSQRSRHFYVAVLLLGMLFVQAMTSIPRLSLTFDEDMHISTGYSVVSTGDLRLIEDHPPLIAAWMSWPLTLSSDVPEPEQVPEWELGDRRRFVRNETWWSVPLDVWTVPARIPIAWLAVLLGAFLFRWAADWFGPRAGLLALAFFAFDPNILANATLATLDLGVTCLIFITMYWFQRTLHTPNAKHLVILGVALGLTLGAKISAAILLPITGGLMLLWGVTHWRVTDPPSLALPGQAGASVPARSVNVGDTAKILVIRLATYLSVASVTLWATHLFAWGTPEGLSFSVPAPTYWRSFLRVGRHVIRGNCSYLLGETYLGGKLVYFPVTFALKTPLPLLLLLLVTAFWGIWRRPHHWWRKLLLASLPVTYGLMSLFNAINLGYRHLLPILPFAYLSIARLARQPEHIKASNKENRRKLKLSPGIIALALFLLWQAVGTLQVWPFYLTYFNEIAGGPRNGWRYLSDSNVDWGQGLKALDNYLEQRAVPDPKLSSFTYFIRPELYGIDATPLPPIAAAPPVLPARFNPSPGTYILSASTLRGTQLVDVEMYNWFWHREPDDVVANALLVYHVPTSDPAPTWLAQCSQPVSPLSPATATEGFGRDDLRMLTFDCTQSWLYPESGTAPGWYILHREQASNMNPFSQQRLAEASLSFEQKQPQLTPPLSIFEWTPQTIVPPDGEQQLLAAPVEWPPAQAMAQGSPLLTPVSMEGPLDFLGYTVSRQGDNVALDTFWHVKHTPEQPFSLMAHAVDATGHPVAVGDGLGVVWDQLHAGDRLVQRHTLSLPEALPAGTLWLQTGAYTLDPVSRFAVLPAGSGDRLLLTEIDIE
jgi:hypothetical protein